MRSNSSGSSHSLSQQHCGMIFESIQLPNSNSTWSSSILTRNDMVSVHNSSIENNTLTVGSSSNHFIPNINPNSNSNTPRSDNNLRSDAETTINFNNQSISSSSSSPPNSLSSYSCNHSGTSNFSSLICEKKNFIMNQIKSSSSINSVNNSSALWSNTYEPTFNHNGSGSIPSMTPHHPHNPHHTSSHHQIHGDPFAFAAAAAAHHAAAASAAWCGYPNPYHHHHHHQNRNESHLYGLESDPRTNFVENTSSPYHLTRMVSSSNSGLVSENNVSASTLSTSSSWPSPAMINNGLLTSSSATSSNLTTSLNNNNGSHNHNLSENSSKSNRLMIIDDNFNE